MSRPAAGVRLKPPGQALAAPWQHNKTRGGRWTRSRRVFPNHYLLRCFGALCAAGRPPPPPLPPGRPGQQGLTCLSVLTKLRYKSFGVNAAKNKCRGKRESEFFYERIFAFWAQFFFFDFFFSKLSFYFYFVFLFVLFLFEPTKNGGPRWHYRPLIRVR